ncbi:MAG: UDP-N-acetylmuramate dehydrogenase [Bacteroidetes bacterium]|nr:UDP-N-acetylmuramate dehydrogenase [Bacteroidota bacterium]
MKVGENISLKPYNTFHIDANARYLFEFSSVEEVKEILSEKKFRDVSKLILGGGSNILLTKNYDGLIIRNNIEGISLVKEDNAHYYIKAGAGEVWHRFVMYCIEHNYAGVENMSLIPGKVGAGPLQNIGAYGVELKDTFFELEALHLDSLSMQKFSNTDCRFGYRESIFKHELKGQFIITSVTFKLNKEPRFNTSYGAIEKELEAMGVKERTIKDISRAVINIRSSKLPDPELIGNAGSFFKNPEIGQDKFESLKVRFPEIVAYPQKSTVKLAAGWLIEQCGWKGKTFGDAGVHKNQALVLVNYGKANGQDIYALSQRIMDSVNEKFDVVLEREVNII